MSDLPILPPLHEWHRVPVGATIPAGTPYMVQYYGCDTVAYPEGSHADLSPDAFPDDKYWTPEPIAPPLPIRH